jgi:hypothetical protein
MTKPGTIASTLFLITLTLMTASCSPWEPPFCTQKTTRKCPKGSRISTRFSFSRTFFGCVLYQGLL